MVIGPAKDGGYYLLGLTTVDARFFQGIQWSTSTVWEDTMNNAKCLGLSVAPRATLPVLEDIDTQQVLKLLMGQIGLHKCCNFINCSCFIKCYCCSNAILMPRYFLLLKLSSCAQPLIGCLCTSINSTCSLWWSYWVSAVPLITLPMMVNAFMTLVVPSKCWHRPQSSLFNCEGCRMGNNSWYA